MPEKIAAPPPAEALIKKLERPILFLSFLWLLVLIAELVDGMSPILLTLGTLLWALFVFYFGARFAISPHRMAFLKTNWLLLFAILVPILRFFPALQKVPLARALTATFGLQVVWIFASADQSLRSLSRTMGRGGAGYALSFTVIVILAGAAGMLHFEDVSSNPSGLHSYPEALYWVAMQITNIGAGYAPTTPGGQILCLGISIFAATILGYLTAVFATFFIGREAKDPASEIAGQASIQKLATEVTALRAALAEVLERLPPVRE